MFSVGIWIVHSWSPIVCKIVPHPSTSSSKTLASNVWCYIYGTTRCPYRSTSSMRFHQKPSWDHLIAQVNTESGHITFVFMCVCNLLSVVATCCKLYPHMGSTVCGTLTCWLDSPSKLIYNSNLQVAVVADTSLHSGKRRIPKKIWKWVQWFEDKSRVCQAALWPLLSVLCSKKHKSSSCYYY